MKFDRLIKRAREIIPLINPENKSFHCSFLLNKNKIVGFGWNDGWRTSPLGKQFGHRFENCHSETRAICRCRWYANELDKLTLVNVRFKRDQSIGLSKPCIPCQNMLRSFGITDIYYTLEGGEFARML